MNDQKPRRQVGVLEDGTPIIEVAPVNPEDLPSDEFLAEMTRQIVKSGKMIQVTHTGVKGKEQVVSIKEL